MILNPKMITTNDLLAHNLMAALLGTLKTDDDVPAATDDPASFAALLQGLTPLDPTATALPAEMTETTETTETTATKATAVAPVTAADNAAPQAAATRSEAVVVEEGPDSVRMRSIRHPARPLNPATGPVVEAASQTQPDPQTVVTPIVRNADPQVSPPLVPVVRERQTPSVTTPVSQIAPELTPGRTPAVSGAATPASGPVGEAAVVRRADLQTQVSPQAPGPVADAVVVRSADPQVSQPLSPVAREQQPPSMTTTQQVVTRSPVVTESAAVTSPQFAAPEAVDPASVVAPHVPPDALPEVAARIAVQPDGPAMAQQPVAASVVQNGPDAPLARSVDEMLPSPESALADARVVTQAAAVEPRTPVESEPWTRAWSEPVSTDGPVPGASAEIQPAQTMPAPGPWISAPQVPAPSVAQADPAVALQAVRLPEVAAEQLREGEPQRLRVQLDPPALGECEIELTLRDGIVRATMVVERTDTAAALRQVEPQIRQALAERGLELSGFDVGQGSAGSSARQGEDARPARDRTSFAAANSDEQTADVTRTRVVGRQHSGRIDLVA